MTHCCDATKTMPLGICVRVCFVHVVAAFCSQELTSWPSVKEVRHRVGHLQSIQQQLREDQGEKSKV